MGKKLFKVLFQNDPCNKCITWGYSNSTMSTQSSIGLGYLSALFLNCIQKSMMSVCFSLDVGFKKPRLLDCLLPKPSLQTQSFTSYVSDERPAQHDS